MTSNNDPAIKIGKDRNDGNDTANINRQRDISFELLLTTNYPNFSKMVSLITLDAKLIFQILESFKS